MNSWEAFGFAMQLSFILLFSVLIPLGIGIWLTTKLHSPLFVLIGAVVGILAATFGVSRMIRRMYGPKKDKGSGQDEQHEASGEEEPK